MENGKKPDTTDSVSKQSLHDILRNRKPSSTTDTPPNSPKPSLLAPRSVLDWLADVATQINDMPTGYKVLLVVSAVAVIGGVVWFVLGGGGPGGGGGGAPGFPPGAPGFPPGAPGAPGFPPTPPTDGVTPGPSLLSADITDLSHGWLAILSRNEVCDTLISELRTYARSLLSLRAYYDRQMCHLGREHAANWFFQQIKVGTTPWTEWVQHAPCLKHLLAILQAADDCYYNSQVPTNLSSASLSSLVDLNPLIRLLVSDGIPDEAAYQIALRLVHLRHLYGDNPFGFYAELLHAIYNSVERDNPAGEVLGILLGVVYSPVIPSPFEPFYFTLAQLYFFVACIGLVLLFFVLFARRVLIPRLRRRFSSFK
jgi:hypothetical protein